MDPTIASVDVLIVGAGVAGHSAARELRGRSSMSILLIDAEDRLPYKRTKLSKFLHQGFGHDEFALEPTDWYRKQDISLKTGCVVQSIDPNERTAVLSDGTVVAWQRLLLATGALPRVPVWPGVREWLVLRNQNDTVRLRTKWEHEREVVILGNGVLGVEIAEQAVLAGKSVRLWGNSLPLPRELTPTAANMLAETLTANGVNQQPPQNEELPWAVAAIGSIPDLRLAHAVGLAVDRGILVDDALRTSKAGIWAAGDGTQRPDRSPSHLWHESEAQGKAAACSMLGEPIPSSRPWRLKCEIFGTYWFSMNKPSDRHPDFECYEGRLYQAFWYRDGRLEAAVMANDKDRNKRYEQAVVEGWDPETVRQKLG
jgi:NAD(P)H-nitrite reductase large subunit